MELMESSAGGVQAMGNGLAVFIDVTSKEVMVKDLRGTVKPLKNYLKTGDILYVKNKENSIKPNHGKNEVVGENSIISGGDFNTVRGNSSAILGGEGNTISSNFSQITGGHGNEISSDFGVINGGKKNKVDGEFSSIQGGIGNDTGGHKNVHIIGSNIIADRDDTTFVNALCVVDLPTSPEGLTKGHLYFDAEKDRLSIVR